MAKLYSVKFWLRSAHALGLFAASLLVGCGGGGGEGGGPVAGTATINIDSIWSGAVAKLGVNPSSVIKKPQKDSRKIHQAKLQPARATLLQLRIPW